jgi:hypothetical protein
MTQPRFDIGDLVRFKMLSTFSEMSSQQPGYWIDGCGAEIPEGCIGLIVMRHPTGDEIKMESFLGWDYDVYVSSLDMTSTNWGEFVLEPIA